MNNNIENRQIRIFISSTFLDMKKERKYLLDEIFPLLREKAIQRDVSLTALDLRWGIPQRLAENGKTIEICMNEIDNSHPFFIGLIGDRYGWCPPLKDFCNSNNLKEQYPMLENYFKHGLSVTEMEMRYAALDRSEKDLELHKIDAYFYLKRTPSMSYAETENADKLDHLKKIIKEKEKYFPVYEYTTLDEIGQQVLKDFEILLDKYFPNSTDISPIERERNRQKSYRNGLCRTYIGNENYLDNLDNFLRTTQQKKVIIGKSGMGKSALIARWLQIIENDKTHKIIYHFVGNGETECNHLQIVSRITEEIKNIFNIPITEVEERREQYQAPAIRIQKMYERIPANEKLLIIIDGLNQISNKNDAKLLAWLPEPPTNIKYIFSTLKEDPTFSVLQKRGFTVLELKPLILPERKELVIRYLKSYSKELDDDKQIESIVSDSQCSNTLVLRTLLDELISVGQHDKMNKIISYYLKTDSIEDFFQLVLKRVTNDEQKTWIKDALSLIAVSQKGLSEEEIIRITNTYQLYWSSFYCTFKNHFIIRNGLITFAHQYLRQAVEKMYLSNLNLNLECRERLINNFQNEETNHALEELPYQYWKTGTYDSLYKMISKQNVFVHLYDNDYISTIQYWATLNSVDKNKYDIKRLITEQPYNDKDVWTWINYRLKLMHFIESTGNTSLILDSTQGIEDVGLTRPQWSELFEVKAHYHESKGEIDIALSYFQKSLDIQNYLFPHETTLHKINLHNMMGGLHLKSLQLEQALHHFKSSLAMAKDINDLYRINIAYSNISNVYAKMGDFGNQEKYNLLIMQQGIAPEGTNTVDGAVTLCNIAIAESRNGKFELAHKHLHEALRIYKSIYGDKGRDVARTYNLIGTCYYNREIYNLAIACKRKALLLYNNIYGEEYEKASLLKDLGINYDCLNDYINSNDAFLKAIIRYARLGNYIEITRIFSHIALNYSSLGLYSKSLKAAKISIKISQKQQIPLSHMGELNYVLGICYYNTGEIRKAYYYFCESMDYTLSSKNYNDEVIGAISDMINACYNELSDIANEPLPSPIPDILTTHQKMIIMQGLDITIKQKIRIASWPLSCDSQSLNILLNNLYQPIEKCLDVFLSASNKEYLLSLVISHWEECLGKGLLTNIITPILFSYRGLTINSITSICENNNVQWAPIQDCCGGLFLYKNELINILPFWKNTIMNACFGGDISNISIFVAIIDDLCYKKGFIKDGEELRYYDSLKKDIQQIKKLNSQFQKHFSIENNNDFNELEKTGEIYHSILTKYFHPQHDLISHLSSQLSTIKLLLNKEDEALKYAKEAYSDYKFCEVVPIQSRTFVHKILGESALKKENYEDAWGHLYLHFLYSYNNLDDTSKSKLISDLHTCKELGQAELRQRHENEINELMPLFIEKFGKYA